MLKQGPIGLIFTMMAVRTGARVLATDSMAGRRKLALKFGASEAFDPRDPDLESQGSGISDRSAAVRILVIVAASALRNRRSAVACSRPGARILLFAQTSHQERSDRFRQYDVLHGGTCDFRVV